MPLAFVDDRYEIDGKAATEEDVVAFRNMAIDAWQEELYQLAIDELGLRDELNDNRAAAEHYFLTGEFVSVGPRFTIETWDWPPPHQAVEFPLGRIVSFGNIFLGRIAEMVMSAYTWARGGPDVMTDDDYTNVAEMVDEQDGYGRGFLSALRRGELSPEQAAFRASMYAGAATKAFEMGKRFLRGAPDRPAWPGDGCEGKSLCRCWWSDDETEDEWRMTWHAAGDENTCGWCSGNAGRWRPHKVPK